jgi:hypothetical protein
MKSLKFLIFLDLLMVLFDPPRRQSWNLHFFCYLRVELFWLLRMFCFVLKTGHGVIFQSKQNMNANTFEKCQIRNSLYWDLIKLLK